MSDATAFRVDSPVAAIGGVGGSGTRVVAEIVNQLGFTFAPDLNSALDNLWFTLLFKYREALKLSDDKFAQLYSIFKIAMRGGYVVDAPDTKLLDELLSRDRAGQHSTVWLEDRLRTLIGVRHACAQWGWKEPNTHMFLERLLKIEHGLRYIHVVRDGVDMAFSDNQNQLRLWGPAILGERYEDSPRGSLRFWRWAHELVSTLSARHNERILMVSFEGLCLAPHKTISRISGFLEHDLSPAAINALAEGVRPPSTIGRSTLRKDVLDTDDVYFSDQLSTRIREIS